MVDLACAECDERYTLGVGDPQRCACSAQLRRVTHPYAEGGRGDLLDGEIAKSACVKGGQA